MEVWAAGYWRSAAAAPAAERQELMAATGLLAEPLPSDPNRRVRGLATVWFTLSLMIAIVAFLIWLIR
jgi:hypothetical protein